MSAEGDIVATEVSTPDGVDHDVETNYKPPPEKTLQEILEADQDDESLRKYKETLLGQAGIVVVEPDDPRRVLVKKLVLVVTDRPDTVLDLTGDVSTLKKETFTIKEGVAYKIRIEFLVQREIVHGLKYVQKTYRMAVPGSFPSSSGTTPLMDNISAFRRRSESTPAPIKTYTPVYPRRNYLNNTDAVPFRSIPSLPSSTSKAYKPIYPITYGGVPSYVPSNFTPKSINASPSISTISHKPQADLSTKDLESLITIKVAKNKIIYDKECKVPTYQTHGKYRGKVLIINNIVFEASGQNERKGAKVDEKNIKTLFQQMGFSVECCNNLKRSEMLNKLKRYGDTFDKKYDISIVIIMSHGSSNKGGNTVIAGSDNNLIDISEVTKLFDNSTCKKMIDIPKIFILQCCRGDDKQIVETDSSFLINNKKILNDILIAYSTIPGYVSFRNPILGSWYMQAICKVFMDHACDTHVEDLLKMVESMLTDLGQNTGYAQTSSYENIGFKKCYLHPM